MVGNGPGVKIKIFFTLSRVWDIPGMLLPCREHVWDVPRIFFFLISWYGLVTLFRRVLPIPVSDMCPTWVLGQIWRVRSTQIKHSRFTTPRQQETKNTFFYETVQSIVSLYPIKPWTHVMCPHHTEKGGQVVIACHTSRGGERT